MKLLEQFKTSNCKSKVLKLKKVVYGLNLLKLATKEFVYETKTPFVSNNMPQKEDDRLFRQLVLRDRFATIREIGNQLTKLEGRSVSI